MKKAKSNQITYINFIIVLNISLNLVLVFHCFYNDKIN